MVRKIKAKLVLQVREQGFSGAADRFVAGDVAA
jgi:hypothetical protein